MPKTDRDDQSEPDSAFDVIALAASAGGLAALSAVLSALPGELPVPIVVVQHLDPRHRSLMAEILHRRSPLLVEEAREGVELKPGVVYLAPPDRHLLVNPDRTVSLSQAELVNFVRPSADLLFESVAGTYGSRTIAVVLTGTGSDGAHGIEAIKKQGGTVVVQNENTAEFAGMPHAARVTGHADFVLDLEEIAGALVELVGRPFPPNGGA